MMCRICKRELQLGDLTKTDLEDETKAVFHGSFGAACLSHEGVRRHYKELSKQKEKEKNEGSPAPS